MAMSKLFGGATLYIPGSYSTTKINTSGTVTLSPTGRVAIIGEAEGGEPGATAGVEVFLNTQLKTIVDIYKSGPIVDAAIALIAPSNDGRIPNGANSIFIYKTNASTASMLVLNTGFGTLNSKNYGLKENLISAYIEKVVPTNNSVQSLSTFSAVGPNFGSGDNFKIRVNGGAVNVFTCPAGISSRALLQTALNNVANWSGGLPAYITFTVGGLADTAATVTITIATLATDNQLGYGRVFELIAGSVDLLAVMNITAGLVSQTSEPKVRIIMERKYDNVLEDTDNSEGDLGGDIYMQIGCVDTTCTLVINSSHLVTNSATLTDLNLKISDFATLNDLAEYINSITGYSCTIPSGINGGLAPSILDRVSTTIAATASVKPGLIKADSYIINKYFSNNSSLVSLARTSFCGLPDALAKTFLAGAVKGTTVNSNITSALSKLEAEDIDIIIPLFSQDATDDIIEDSSYTDANSVYTIDAINLAVKNHCVLMSGIKFKKERRCYISKRGTFSECKAASLAINNERASIAIQDSYALGSDGSLHWFRPCITSCYLAGMQAGAEIGQPTTFKSINVNGIKHVKKQGVTPSALELFDPRTQSETAIINGIVSLMPSGAGIRIVLQNSTYSKDDNFVYNRPSVLYCTDYVAASLRTQLENAYTGVKNNVSAAEIKAVVESIFSGYIKNGIIVGYKNIVITLSGNTIYVDVIVIPIEGIDFILNRIEVQRNEQTA